MSASDDKHTQQVGAAPPVASDIGDIGTRVALAKAAGILTIIAGPEEGRSFSLTHSSTFIGREPQPAAHLANHIVLAQDTSVHREPHAAIECKNGVFILHDMQRRNLVAVNGRQIDRPTAVRFGDDITIGSTTLRLSSR